MNTFPGLTFRYKKGVYMGGSIQADKGTCECGGKFKQKKLPQYKYEVPVCEKCQGFPKKYRIRAYLPSLGPTVIRHTIYGERLECVEDCVFMLKNIHGQIEAREFDVKDYLPKNVKDKFLFKAYSEQFLNFMKIRLSKKSISPKYYGSLEEKIRLYLIPRFGKYRLEQITMGRIQEFFDEFPSTDRQRTLSVQTLRTMLIRARRLEHIKVVPEFPETEKPAKKKGFIDYETQNKILSGIVSPVVRNACRTQALYMLRPCEVRAIRYADIDRKKGKLYIKRHFTLGELREGRKSHAKDEYSILELPLLDEFIVILKSMPEPFDKNMYVFRNKKGQQFGESAFRKAWNKSCEKLGITGQTFYCGTKHATASNLRKVGAPLEEIAELCGISNMEVMRRYAESPREQIHANLIDYRARLVNEKNEK